MAVAGAVIAALLLLDACAADSAEVVRPGPPAAAAQAVANGSLPVTRPLPAPVATCTNAPAGWSALENRRPGDSGLPPSRSVPGVGEVGGYLDSFTAVCGQQLSVHLSAYRGPARIRLRALRIGDYQGRGARLVMQSPVLTAHRQQEGVPNTGVCRRGWKLTRAA